MASSLNRVTLIGNLGSDPESRSLGNGNSVVNFRMATSESWKDKGTGEWKKKDEWHSVAIFNPNVSRYVQENIRKGDQVYVEGQLQTRKWQDQSGNDRYTTEIVVQQFKGDVIGPLGKRGGGEDRQERSTRSGDQAGGGRQKPDYRQDLDDDLPF